MASGIVGWMRAHDPNGTALHKAIKVAIAVTLGLAIGTAVDTSIDTAQLSLFASFGGVALLLFADFPGGASARLGAYLGLYIVGLALIALGTVLSPVAWLAVTGMLVTGFLVLFSGVLILIGAVAMTKFQRVYEAAVFKTLGANTRTIARMLLFEYGVLGSLAGLIGSLGAVVLTWGVSRYALEIPWRVFVGEHIGGVVLTAILVALIGVLSSLDVLRNKPLATLRAE